MNDVNRQALEAGKVPKFLYKVFAKNVHGNMWKITVPFMNFEKTVEIVGEQSGEHASDEVVEAKAHEIMNEEEGFWLARFMDLPMEERASFIEKYEKDAAVDPTLLPIKWFADPRQPRKRGTIFCVGTTQGLV